MVMAQKTSREKIQIFSPFQFMNMESFQALVMKVALKNLSITFRLVAIYQTLIQIKMIRHY